MARPVKCKSCEYKWHHENNNLRRKWFKDYRRCPICGVLYCDLPHTEKKLMELQDIYLINRSIYIYKQMEIILIDYAISLIKKGPIYKIDKDQLKNNAMTAVSLFFEYYLKDKNFKVVHSFAGLLKFKISEACFGKKEHMMGDISLNYKLSDGKEVEYEDGAHQIDYIKQVEQDYDKLLLYKRLKKIIENYDEYDSNEEKFLSYAGLYFYFCRNESRSSAFYRILEESENKKRILVNRKFKKYNKVSKKKRGKPGKFHFIQIKDRLRSELLRDLEG